jgi:hypothetical protein
MDYNTRFSRRGFIGACTSLALIASTDTLEASFSNDILKKQDDFKKEFEKLMYMRSNYSRKKIILEYDGWKSLIERPNSLDASDALSKSKKISSLDERWLLYAMTDEERRDYKIFKNTFDLDIKKISEQLSDDKETFINLVFPIILDMQLELDRTYKTTFNFTNPNPGDKVLWFFHYRHAGTYQAKEGKTIPSYLAEKQKELEKENLQINK